MKVICDSIQEGCSIFCEHLREHEEQEYCKMTECVVKGLTVRCIPPKRTKTRMLRSKNVLLLKIFHGPSKRFNLNKNKK